MSINQQLRERIRKVILSKSTWNANELIQALELHDRRGGVRKPKPVEYRMHADFNYSDGIEPSIAAAANKFGLCPIKVSRKLDCLVWTKFITDSGHTVYLRLKGTV